MKDRNGKELRVGNSVLCHSETDADGGPDDGAPVLAGVIEGMVADQQCLHCGSFEWAVLKASEDWYQCWSGCGLTKLDGDINESDVESWESAPTGVK